MPSVAQPTAVLQGITTPDLVIDPNTFFAATRRQRFSNHSASSIAGFGSGDQIALRQQGVISKLFLNVKGTLTFGGTITSTEMTWKWPYDLVRQLRISANGQANLISCSGLQLQLLRALRSPQISSLGLDRTVDDVATTSGTLSTASEDWGTYSTNVLGPARTVPATGAYTVDLWYEIPLSFDDRSLLGAIYAQTNATELTLAIDWETQANLVTLGGSATLTSDLKWSVWSEVYNIPTVNGKSVVPDLSAFHSIVASNQSGLGSGENEVNLPGIGPGKQLMRTYGAVWTGSTEVAKTPLAVNDTNYGGIGWRFGGNDTPEISTSGGQWRHLNNNLYNEDVGRHWGFWVIDFATEFAFRDSVALGSVTDPRLVFTLNSAPTSGRLQYVQELVIAAPAGA